MDQTDRNAEPPAPAPLTTGGRAGQLFALIIGAIGLAFVGVYFTQKRARERTPAEAADAAVTAALAARAASDPLPATAADRA
ncbi:MAG: hypothetical protein NVSMB19_26090 [Vulcanimicrobiaceae bacterium]